MRCDACTMCSIAARAARLAARSTGESLRGGPADWQDFRTQRSVFYSAVVAAPRAVGCVRGCCAAQIWNARTFARPSDLGPSLPIRMPAMPAYLSIESLTVGYGATRVLD